MPFKRCWNFENNGSRKTRSNGSEMQCLPSCQFVHPSDPGWDRAPTAPVRGRGGAPQGGRGRGQSSFGPPASGVNSSALGSSSGAWDDYITDFDHTLQATSGSRGAPSRRSGQTRPESSGWGSSGADGPGWGSSANNNENPSNGWSNEPGAHAEQASSSQWNTQADGWGSSGDRWGSSNKELGPSGNGWGPSNDGWGSSGKELGPSGNAWGSSGNEGNSEVATATTRSPRVSIAVEPPSQTDIQESSSTKPVRVAIPSTPTPGELDPAHNEECGENTSEPATPLDSKLIKMRPPHVDHDNHFISRLSDTENMGFVIAVTLKMRELDAELSQLSALRKSRQVVATRAAKELLQNKVHNFTDARVATEAEHNFCSGKLTQPDFLCRTSVQHALAALSRDNEQLERFNDWVSRAEACLSHARPPNRLNSSIKKSNEATSVSKLNQIQRRSESLAETILQCQDQQIYNTFLDHQTQDKMDLIVAAIVQSLDISYNHLISTSFIPLQRQGEVCQQTLQSQAEKFAQVLLQSDQLKKEQRNQSSFKQKGRGAVQQLQADIIHKMSQLQVLQEEMVQLHHTLALMEHQQQNFTIINTLDEHEKHIQEYIQRYIQENATFLINAELSKAVVQFTAAELKTVEKVWKTLQPLAQMFLWLQHSDNYKAEEEMEIREIEEFLLA